MSAVATIEHQAAPAPPITANPRPDRPLSRKARQAIDLLATGKAATQKSAAEAVGMHPETLCRVLQRSSARVFLEQRARQTIAIGVARASERVIELVDASSEHVSLDAAKHVLGIANIRPPDSSHGVSVNVGVSVGYVIDLTPGAHVSSAPDIRTQIVEHDQ